MIDIERFLIFLRNHKNSDGLLYPIYLADNLQEEINILQDAIQHSCREWVGLTDEVDELAREMVKGDKSVNWLARAIEAKLREKNA